MKKKSRHKRFLSKKSPAGENRSAVSGPESIPQARQKATTTDNGRRPTDFFIDPATSRYLQTTYGNRAVLSQQKSVLSDSNRISKPGDAAERQAVTVADQILQPNRGDPERSNRGATLTSAPEPGSESFRPANLEPKNPISGQPDSKPSVESVNNRGEELGDSSRAFFEHRFGQDFSRVRIHRDADSAKAASALNARAFTAGGHIYFGRNEYSPETGSGRKLLAHELNHVVQQRCGLVPPIIHRETAAASPERDAVALLTSATDLLGASPPHAPLPGIRQLMQESGNVLSHFFPSGYGIIDSSGRVTRGSARTDLYTTVRRGSAGISMPFEFRVNAFISHETGGAAAGRYIPQGNWGGRIIFFINHLSGNSVDEVAELMAHELFHMWAHAQRAMRERFGDEAAGQLPTRAAARILDPGRFSSHRRTMQRHFTSLIGYLDAEQRRRGVLLMRSSRSERASRWADLAVEEVSAYVYGVCAREAITTEHTRRTAARTGAPAVGMGSFFNAVAFLRSYVRNHWLQDPADRTALDRPRGQSLLAGMRDDILALKRAVESHIGCRRS